MISNYARDLIYLLRTSIMIILYLNNFLLHNYNIHLPYKFEKNVF